MSKNRIGYETGGFVTLYKKYVPRGDEEASRRDGDTFRRGREKAVRANKGGAVVEGRPGDWGEVVTR